MASHPTLDRLEQALQALRDGWRQDWPGLPAVVEGCLVELGGSLAPRAPRRAKLLHQATMATAFWLEQDGAQRARHGTEPAYHNRLHTADTLVALATLLRAQRSLERHAPAQPTPAERLGLLAMAAHDLLHDGSINRFESELESRSADHLQPLLTELEITPVDAQRVRALILATDPARVPEIHARVRGRRFCVADDDCLAVLLVEADILASTLVTTGLPLTAQLAVEWDRVAPERAQTLRQPLGRLGFLEHAALFSSPASTLLGLPAVRQAQIDALRAARGG